MARVASLKTWLDRFESDERCSPRIGVTAAERQKTGETLCERVTLLWTSSTRMQRCHRFSSAYIGGVRRASVVERADWSAIIGVNNTSLLLPARCSELNGSCERTVMIQAQPRTNPPAAGIFLDPQARDGHGDVACR